MKQIKVRGGILKRPITATPEKAWQLKEQGYTWADIARLWGITPQRVGQIKNKVQPAMVE